MRTSHRLFMLATAATFGAACGGYNQSAAGDIAMIDPADAAKTVVLQAINTSNDVMELRVVAEGSSRFVGSVGSRDSTVLLLDPSLFPTAELYLVAIPGDARGRAVAGPVAASKGDRIRFTIDPTLGTSRAIVIR